MSFQNHLAYNLNFLMQSLKISSNILSKETGIRTATIYKLKEGTINNPTIETIYPIAMFFKFTIDELIGVKLYKTSSEPNKSSIPLISYLEISNYPNVNIIRYVSTDFPNANDKYCVVVLEDNCKFEKNSILIIDTTSKHKNHDYLIVKRKNDNSISIKRVIYDDDHFLQSITNGLENKLFELKDYLVLGVVVGYLKYYRTTEKL